MCAYSPQTRPKNSTPRAAEHELRRALGEQMPSYPDEESSARAHVIVLTALTDSHPLDGAALDHLLAQARSRANS
jgi:hypothetical protein